MSKPEWQTDAPDKPYYSWDYKPGDEFLFAATAHLLSGSASEPAKGGLTEFLKNVKRRSNPRG